MPEDPFISRGDLGNYLRRDLSTDAAALIAIDAASQMVRSATEQVLTAVADDEITVDGEGRDVILLPELPVTEVSSFVYDEDEIAEDDYWVDLARGAIYSRNGNWLRGRGLYTIIYSHGFEEVPTDLRILALTLAARIYDQQLVKQESVGGYQAIYGAEESLGFSRREKDIIAKYKRPS